MKRDLHEEVEQEIELLKAILERAAPEYSEEEHGKMCAMMRALGEVKRELLKKRPSMNRIEQLVLSFDRSELEQIAADLRARVAQSRGSER